MNPAVIEAPVAEAPVLSRIEQLKQAMAPAVAEAVAGLSAVEPVAEVPAVTEVPIITEDDFLLDVDSDEPPVTEAAPLTETEPVLADSEDVPNEVQGAFLATSRGRRMLGAFKTMREIEKLPSEGGLGFVPTINEIKEFHAAQQDWQSMQRDFSAPEPEAKARFLDFWVGPDNNGQVRPGTEELVELLPVYLNERNPQAFQRLARPMYEGLAQRFLALAEQHPAEKDALIAAADLIMHDQLGKPRGSALNPNVAAPAQNQLPPEIQRELEEGRRLRLQMQQQQTAQQQQAVTTFSQTIEAKKKEALDADVDRVLSKATMAKQIDPFLFESVKSAVKQKIQSYLTQNTTGMDRVNHLVNRAVQTRNPQMVGTIVQEYRRLYGSTFTAAMKDAMRALNVTVAEKTQATAQTLQKSQGFNAPTMSAAAPSNNGATNANRLPNESRKQQLARVIGAGIR